MIRTMEYSEVLNCVKLVGPLLSPVDLMALSKVCVVWYQAVRHVYPTFNLRASLRNIVGSQIDDLLSAGCYIFGSTLVHAMHYTPGSEKPILNDIDLFYPVSNIYSLKKGNLVFAIKNNFMKELVKNHQVEENKSYSIWRDEKKVKTFTLEKSGKKCYDLNFINTYSYGHISERIDSIIKASYYDMQQNYYFMKGDKFVFKSFSPYSHFTRIATYMVECKIEILKLASYAPIFKKFKFDLTSTKLMAYVAELRESYPCTFTLQDTYMIINL